MPTLSVILANRNHGKLLRRSLPALFAQTRPADEYIILDDASTDDSVAVITELAAGRTPVTLIQHASSQGVLATFHEGLQRARGDYVYFAAADDVTLPDLFACLLDAAKKNPGAGLCLGGHFEFFDDGRAFHRVVPSLATTSEFLDGAGLRRRLRSGEQFYYPPTSVIIRRDTLLATGAYHPQSEWFHDIWYNLQAGLREGVCFVPEALSAFRINPEGFSGAGVRYDDGKLGRVVRQLWPLAREDADLWITLIAAMPWRVRRLMWKQVWSTPRCWGAGLRECWPLLAWPKLRPFLWPVVQWVTKAGSAGLQLRAWRTFGATIAPTARVERGVTVDRPWRLRVDDGAVIGPGVKICAREAVHIGAQAIIEAGCEIDASRQSPTDDTSNPILIGARAYIGENSRILAGAFITEGQVVPRKSTLGVKESPEPARQTLQAILHKIATPISTAET